MKIVYLDQWAWIRLARVETGREVSPKLSALLTIMRGARDLGQACFPLSLAHYMETQAHRNATSRQRLARFMRELSAGKTFVDLGEVVRHEIRQALDAWFHGRVPADQLRSIQVLGEGLAFAGGYPIPKLQLVGSGAEKMDPRKKRAYETFANKISEESFLSGVAPFTDAELPWTSISEPSENFKKHLGLVTENLGPMEEPLRRRANYAISMLDIRQPLTEAMQEYGISWADLEALGMEQLMEFLDHMPSRRVDTHLRWQWAKNPQLRPRHTDLNDWAHLGAAVMYCDIAVVDKHWANLLRRDEFKCSAVVLTRLEDLPSALLN